jgi:hypothetical protein
VNGFIETHEDVIHTQRDEIMNACEFVRVIG